MLHYVAPLWSCGLTCSPLRQGILAYGRTRGYFYAYYITKTLTATVCEGSMMCLSLAYVVSQHVPASSWRHQQAVSWLDCCAEPYASSLLQADRVPEARRAAAFGVFSGVCTAGFVASTVAARFLPVSSTCQVCVREHTPAVILGIRWTRVTQLHSSGAAGRRGGSCGDGRVHEGLPPGDGRRSLLVQL